MRSGGFHQRVFYSPRHYSKRPNPNHNREDRFPTRRQMDNFLKKLQTYEFVERTETKLILQTIKEGNIKVE